MIVSRTPFRVSFVGGGSDLESFYRHQPGAVVSAAINKYIYITANKNFDSNIRLKYSEVEEIDKVEDIKHHLIRESLKLMKVPGEIEISSLADIPVKGTGLGSSSSYLVGVINALHAYSGLSATAEELAKHASFLEIEKLGRSIGKQDHYAAAFGGLNFIRFLSDGSVTVEPIKMPEEKLKALEKNLLMFYTGMQRDASKILSGQKKNFEQSEKTRDKMKDMVKLAETMRDDLQSGRLEKFGKILHDNWILKKEMADGISNPQIDAWYEVARNAGAEGGKILGAGGGGFLLFYAPEEKHAAIVEALKPLRKFDFKFEPKGSIIINIQKI